MREFDSTNDMLEGFMISVYVLGVSSIAILHEPVLSFIVCLWTSQYESIVSQYAKRVC